MWRRRARFTDQLLPIERPPLHFQCPRNIHPSCERDAPGTPKPSDGRRGVCAGLASRQNFDNYSMQRKIRETNWRFLQLRGGKETRLMGRGRQEILRRGVGQILAETKGRKFSSMEISVLVSESFFGVMFLNISVNLRHFQRNTAV